MPTVSGLRIGGHFGAVLYRGGKYLGDNLDVASGVGLAAPSNQFVVTDGLRRLANVTSWQFVSLGPRVLKGTAAPLELFDVRAVPDKADVPDSL